MNYLGTRTFQDSQRAPRAPPLFRIYAQFPMVCQQAPDRLSEHDLSMADLTVKMLQNNSC